MECSDKSRRTMSQALRTVDLSAEARAFLTPPVPQSFSPSPAPKPPAVGSTVPQLPLASAPANIVAVLTPPAAPPSDPPPAAGLVSMTFRLAPELPAALLRASVERKVRKQRPCTQQEIVTEAVKQWLKANGFLP